MKHFALWSALLCAFVALAQQTPKGWQVIEDRSGHCRFAVPADWKASGIGAAVAPDNKARVGIHPNLRNDTWHSQQKLQKENYSKFKMYDHTDKRLWYAIGAVHKPTQSDPMHWQVTVPDSDNVGFCKATIDFSDASAEPTAKKIAESVHLH